MGERSDQIEQEIAETRNDLNENISELERKVKSAVDWRSQFEERPGAMLALAFGGGMILSAMFPTIRRSRPRYENGARTSDVSDSSSSTSSFQSSSNTKSTKLSETRQNIEALTGALLGVGVNRLTGFIDSVLPGFECEFSRSKASKGHDSYRMDSASNSESGWTPKT